jgi:hypothetical protein
MKENFHTEKGQVNNPETAEQLAYREKPYREKILGVIPTSKKRIEKGEMKAEHLEELYEELNNTKMTADTRVVDMSDVNAFGKIEVDELFVKGMVNKHNLDLKIVWDKFDNSVNFDGKNGSEGEMDGKKLSREDLVAIVSKYHPVFAREVRRLLED